MRVRGDSIYKECRMIPDNQKTTARELISGMSEEPDKDLINGGDEDRGLLVEAEKPALKKPPLYQVILLNDDYTPMDFVVEVLELIFGMDRQKATRIMLEVHTKGKGRCGVFTYEIAETKIAQISSYSQQHQHPLLSTLEEV